MKVGIISDTHDNLPLVDKAIERLNREKVKLVLHAGDYVAPFTVKRFENLEAKLIGVFGNNDGDHMLLRKRFTDLNTAEIRGRFAEILTDGLKIALLHGEENELLEFLSNANLYDVLVYGHSHKAATFNKGRTNVVNPGEVCGYLTGNPSMALLDTVRRETTIVKL
ncbi:MAG: metallophosphoesterase [Candidatus Bathyarchaeota archaeon]|nr:metallophosphoesterase [Candidatus Bathyarchaeota archaeon]